MSGSFVKKFSSITSTELKKTLKELGVYFESNATKDTLYALYTSVLAPEELETKQSDEKESEFTDKKDIVQGKEKKVKEKEKVVQEKKKYIIYMTFISNYYNVPTSEYKDIFNKRKYKTSFPGTYIAEEADIDNHTFIYYSEKAFQAAITKLTFGFYKLNYSDPTQIAQIINLFKGERGSDDIAGYRVDDSEKGAEKNYTLGSKEAVAFDTLDFTDMQQDDYESSISNDNIIRNIGALKVFQVYINKIYSVPEEPETEEE